ncbi:hypothetical protein [Aggregatibacter aphrophilus]|uniref:hypothetical protein n=1 Tax=Aggregatibacter aphrophilus TaxID=732 RepID=UPI000D6EAF74|nr:hypothetical protein [Aggregatibacter aphrophilus]
MALLLDYDGITDGTTMAQASTLVPITKMKKAQAWTLALSWSCKANKINAILIIKFILSTHLPTF